MYTIKNVRAKIPAAIKERHTDNLEVAANWAKATSEFFHGVYEISGEGGPICYYVGGRKYLRIDTALARA